MHKSGIRDPELRLLKRILRSNGSTLERAYSYFYHHADNGTVFYKQQPRFFHRVGVHMGRPTEAIISAKGRFVLMRLLDSNRWNAATLHQLDPTCPFDAMYSGKAYPWNYPQHRNLSWLGTMRYYNIRNQGVIKMDPCC